jgi:flagella basal body P-ring formation protein FlgA
MTCLGDLKMYRLLVPALLCATPAMAAPFQDTVAIDRAVAAFTGQGTGVAGGARSTVDARLKLAACPMVSLAWRSDTHDAVVVTCTGPAWRIFVPVLIDAAAQKRSAPGAAAVPPRAEPVIRRGDPVTIEAGSASFSIMREGVALGDAAPGARFLVKVEGGKAPVQAVAVETGRATLPGWIE